MKLFFTRPPAVKHISTALLVIFTLMLLSPPAFAISAAVSELRERLENAENTEAVIVIAEQTIKEGEKTIDTLREEISRLESEKAELERVQTTLTSGLIGAFVTAIIAIVGAVSRTVNSRVERDYRRLEVVQKLAELNSQGISTPADIQTKYLGQESHSQS